MLTHKNGCLLEALRLRKVDTILHIVNCQGVMGSGVAAAIRSSYPAVYKEYSELASYSLGDVQEVQVDECRSVWNLFAQYDYGRGKRHLNYGALADCLDQVSSVLQEQKLKIGLPYAMGCDRAGGDWEVVEEMLDYYLGCYSTSVYKLGK